MKEKTNNKGFFKLNGVILLLFIILVSLLAWITYGTVAGVFGMVSYLIIGWIGLFPWIIPIVGIFLGILDLAGILNFGIYGLSLNLSHLNSSWMSVFWFLITSMIGVLIDIFLTIVIIVKIKDVLDKNKGVKKNLALINCTVIDGNLDSSPIENAVILIKNLSKVKDTIDNLYTDEQTGIITEVGKSKEIKIPPDYKKIDLKGKYVLPGIINAHCHLMGSGKPTKLMKLSDKWINRLIKFLDTPIGKWLLFNMMKKNALNALNAGITTLRTMSDPLFIDLKLRDKINDGKILGPRLMCAGKGICITGGHGFFASHIADSVPEVRKGVRTNLREEVDVIKILSTGGVMDARKVGEAGRPQMTIEEIETACFEAHRGNLLVATHCESTKGIEEALKGGVDTIEHGAEIPEDLIPLFKENPKALRGYTALIPTVSAGMGLATLPAEVTKITDVKRENAKLIEKGMIKGLQIAYENGIEFGVGTDASVPYSTHYEVWKELKYFMKYTKMIAKEAIYRATKKNAEILGIDDITGSIEP
ncbi:MAG: Imidazolonepropionase (modular protein), partial [Promethearchaeota archaeon]